MRKEYSDNRSEKFLNVTVAESNLANINLSATDQDGNSSLTWALTSTNSFVNLQYELNSNDNHTLKTGVSLKTMNIAENIAFADTIIKRNYDGDYHRNENIAGVFAENTLSFFKGKLTWIAGIRGDNHNQFGFFVTPRTLLKYDPTPNTTIRVNIGTGWRTVNLFSENIGLLASSRNIIFAEALRPEKALNTGINVTQKFTRENVSGYISGDFYRTDFRNQVFPDYDSDPTKAIIKNFTGKSVSNGFQTDLFLKFYKVSGKLCMQAIAKNSGQQKGK